MDAIKQATAALARVGYALRTVSRGGVTMYEIRPPNSNTFYYTHQISDVIQIVNDPDSIAKYATPLRRPIKELTYPRFIAGKLAESLNPQFRTWFGRSKVVDQDGNPLPVYHGTNLDFDTFGPGKSLRGDGGIFEYPVQSPFKFFTPDIGYARGVADSKGYRGQRVIKAYLKMERPLDLRTPMGLYAGHRLFRFYKDNPDIQEIEDEISNEHTDIDRLSKTSIPSVAYYQYDGAGNVVAASSRPNPGYVRVETTPAQAIKMAREEIKALQRKLVQVISQQEKLHSIWDVFDDPDSGEKLKQAGYDGVIFYENGGSTTYAVPDATQIKAVTSKGFDPTSAKIHEGQR